MSTNKCSVLSFSGGMIQPHCYLLFLSRDHDFYAISFKYGQKHEVEVELVKRISDTLVNKGFKDKITHKVFDF